MKIFQLAHTSPYIGGQVRIDVVLNRHSDGRVYADELYVVPLSDTIVYNDATDYEYLNYHHTDNIKYLYEQIGDDMFRCAGQFRDTHYWLYNEKHYSTDTCDHTYDMGLKRMRYKRYNKQFSFLSPLWVQTTKDEAVTMDSICFEIVFEGIESHNPARRAVRNSAEIVLSDRVRKYLDDFLALNDDRLLSIRFDNSEMYVDGIYAPSGTHLQQDIGYTYLALISQQRTVYDFDRILARTLTQNRSIAKQLLNFNFVFDPQDIISSAYVDLRTGRNNMYVNAFCRDSLNRVVYYPVRDFYSNYEFIPTYSLEADGAHNDNGFVNINIFDLNHENRDIEKIYTNKVNQPVVHWSLLSNERYIYNLNTLYGTLVYRDNNEELNEYDMSHYYDTPDLDKYEYNYKYDNISFCNGFRCFNQPTPATKLKNYCTTDTDKFVVMETKYGEQWLHNNKFEVTDNFVRKWTDNNRTHKIEKMTLVVAIGDDGIDIKDLAQDMQNMGVTEYGYIRIFHTPQQQPPTQKNVKSMLYWHDPNETNHIHLVVAGDRADTITHSNLVIRNWFDNVTARSFRDQRLAIILNNFFDVAASQDYEMNIDGGSSTQYDQTIFPDLWEYIADFLSLYSPPYRIDFANTILARESHIDNTLLNNRNEVELYSYDGVDSIFYRYSGLLLPYFIDAPTNDALFYNKRYRYIQWNDDDLRQDTVPDIFVVGRDTPDKCMTVKEYNTCVNEHLVPDYPSIGFCSINGFRDIFSQDSPLVDEYEETYWYKRNRVYVLPITVTVTVNNWRSDNTIKTTEEVEQEYWDELYAAVFGRPDVDERLEHQDARTQLTADEQRARRKEFLQDRYKCSYNFDYFSPTDVKRVVYRVHFTLY